ncbi:hypothetical protein ALC53_09506 [Atta colombica]|uniref:Uncharacterized protein n=1 Tax=Atta colombica TaxID=520822 RepID=A0A195B6U1_9HYME|nr:hypothetical protein ALC53_09506 [Atta colombica]
MRGREKEGSTGRSHQAVERRKAVRQREKKIDREKEAWSGQDRRANGGHRTEMASGSAFQYSTLATLGHPTSSDPLPPVFLARSQPPAAPNAEA